MTTAMPRHPALTLGALFFLTLSLPAQEKDKTQDKQGGTAAVKIDAAIPAYKPAAGIAGALKSVGSDTMLNEMARWAASFKKLYPGVEIEIEGKGSNTAPPALVAGTAQFGPMSRPMKNEEIDAFEKAFGYKPANVATSIDMLAVYVHKDNPIQSLTLQQVDAIFSKTRKGGADKEIKTWGELGLTGEWANRPISLYGRNSASGTYNYFKEHALFKGDYKDTVKEQAGSSSVVQGVATDRFAMGYSGIGYRTADVRAVPLARDGKARPIEAVVENAYSGEYPLARFLFVYVNLKPGTQLDPLRSEFLRYVLSQEGQTDAVNAEYFPLTARQVKKEREKLGIASEQ